MAILTFDKLLDAPESLTNLNICNEPDNTLTKFGITPTSLQGNYLAELTLSQYDTLTWLERYSLLTSSEIVDIGVKHFPQIGSIGFYKLKHENKSMIVAPVFTKNKRYVAPTVTCSQVGSNLHFTITQPTDVTYECFRIVMRNGYDATEIITYDLTCDAPLPYPDGTYSIYCVGYIEEQLASQPSNELTMSITGSINPFQPSPVPSNIQDQFDAIMTLLANKFDSVDLNSSTKLMRFFSEATLKQSVDVSSMVNVINEDAPTDGKQYGRQLAGGGMQWTEVGSTVTRPRLIQTYTTDIDSNVTLSQAITCGIGDLLLVAFVVRSSYTLPSGWSLLTEVTLSSSSIDQKLVVITKIADATSDTVTVVQSTAARIYINALVIRDANSIPIVETSPAITGNPSIETSRTSDWPCLHLLHAISWTTSSPFAAYTCSDANVEIKSVAPARQGRLGTAFDDVSSGSITFTQPSANDVQYIRLLIN